MSGWDIRVGLGGYAARGRPLPPGALTLHDIGELIRRAGLDAGFVVETEFKCRVRASGGNRRKMDWVWFAKGDRTRTRPLVALEVEGRDVYEDRLEADREKFTDCSAPVSILALFQVDHDLTPKSAPPHKEDAVRRAKRLLALPNVKVLLDQRLMSPGGVEAIQQAALRALASSTRARR